MRGWGGGVSLHFVSLLRSFINQNSFAALVYFTHYAEPYQVFQRKPEVQITRLNQEINSDINAGINFLAGVEGFEPPNAWTKTMCLTTWRHPTTYVRIPCDTARQQGFGHGLFLIYSRATRSDSHAPYHLATPQYIVERLRFRQVARFGHGLLLYLLALLRSNSHASYQLATPQ